MNGDLNTARAAEMQAIARARRFGQKRDRVKVLRFVAKDTIEEQITKEHEEAILKQRAADEQLRAQSKVKAAKLKEDEKRKEAEKEAAKAERKKRKLELRREEAGAEEVQEEEAKLERKRRKVELGKDDAAK